MWLEYAQGGSSKVSKYCGKVDEGLVVENGSLCSMKKVEVVVVTRAAKDSL